jgi:uncharacterized protein (DUF427 family)
MDQRRRVPIEPGEESVWDYPRPPRVERTNKHIQVVFNGVIIADTKRALRVLETSHPPVYYVPPEDVKREYLSETDRHTFCEFKGMASYYTVSVNGKTARHAAWYYANPVPAYNTLHNHVAFYPSRMDACYVNGELAQPQEGDFYGGWITHDIKGPFKGGLGTVGW